jgi:hypothetical protein
MATLPTIKRLFENYPKGTPDEVATLIGGTIGDSITEHGWETCCIRLSRALNYAGAPIEGLSAISNPYMESKKVRAQKGADDLWYIYSTYDMRAYLTGAYRPPTRLNGNVKAKDVLVPGIILFGWRHIDLWDGEKICNLALFGHSSAKTHGVFLWPTPAEWAG